MVGYALFVVASSLTPCVRFKACVVNVPRSLPPTARRPLAYFSVHFATPTSGLVELCHKGATLHVTSISNIER